MGDRSPIEWTDATWNPVTGCTRVSEGCRNCYMARMVPRQGQDPWTVALHPERMDQPLRWRRPRRIFVNSLSDLFHDDVPDSFIEDVYAVMFAARHHTFQILTKRPERAKRFLEAHEWCVSVGSSRHIWLGVSVEDQATADARIPILLNTPAAVRFVSAEPLLGPVDLTKLFIRDGVTGWGPRTRYLNALTGWEDDYPPGRASVPRESLATGRWLDWVIVGGESGPKARPMHPEWARSIRDQCRAAGVPFFFKQWGEWGPSAGHGEARTRVGKKAAGRVLDGRTWDEGPR